MIQTCTLCFHHCQLDEGQTGFCRARAGRGDKIVPLNYGRLTSLALDPIEKKPLQTLPSRQPDPLRRGASAATCACPFCQNASIAQIGAKRPRAM